jgi:hypothetical protein
VSPAGPRLDATRVTIAGIAALALCLAGVLVLAPRGAADANGLVIDERGYGVADAAVYLFSETRQQLVAETRTDAGGAFRLHLDVPDARVLVTPAPHSGLVAAWGLSMDAARERDAGDALAFVLRRARPLEVRVRDARGRPLAGAEVRVYDEHGETAVVALALTDWNGRARLGVPARASVAVLAPAPVRLVRWRLDVEVRAEGSSLAFTLPDAELVAGRVTDGEAGLAGVVVVSTEGGPGATAGPEPWNGFALTDASGAFRVPRTAGPAELVALDPGGTFLPRRIVLPPALAGAPAAFPRAPRLALARGAPRTVHVAHAGQPLDARVWSWSPADELWGWGARSGTSGTVRLPVSSDAGLRADPIDPAHGALEAWNVSFEEPPTLLESGTIR